MSRMFLIIFYSMYLLYFMICIDVLYGDRDTEEEQVPGWRWRHQHPWIIILCSIII